MQQTRVGDGGNHSLTCACGGGTKARHDAVRDAIAQWLTSHGFKALLEQHVPRWDRPTVRNQEHAILDVTYIDSQEGLVCIDVSIVAAAAESAEGVGILQAVREKGQTYKV